VALGITDLAVEVSATQLKDKKQSGKHLMGAAVQGEDRANMGLVRKVQAFAIIQSLLGAIGRDLTTLLSLRMGVAKRKQMPKKGSSISQIWGTTREAAKLASIAPQRIRDAIEERTGVAGVNLLVAESTLAGRQDPDLRPQLLAPRDQNRTR